MTVITLGIMRVVVLFVRNEDECQGSGSNSINFEGEDAERRSVDEYPVAGGTETDNERHGNVYHKITSRDNANEQCYSNDSATLKDIITPDCDYPDSKHQNHFMKMCATGFRLGRVTLVTMVQGFPKNNFLAVNHRSQAHRS